jgi:uncharacterized OB-fold protein
MATDDDTGVYPRLYSYYDKPMWDSIAAHEMSLQRCTECGRFRYPPGACCPGCLSVSAEWTPISGRGRLISWTTFHRQYLPAYPVPVTCVAVQLEEGPIVIGNIEPGDVDNLALDVPVTLFYDVHPDGYALPRFRIEVAERSTQAT